MVVVILLCDHFHAAGAGPGELRVRATIDGLREIGDRVAGLGPDVREIQLVGEAVAALSGGVENHRIDGSEHAVHPDVEADAGDPVVVGGIDYDGDLEAIDDERIRVRRADDDGGRQVFGDRDGGGGDLLGGVSFGIDEVEGKPAGSGGAERGGGGISGLFARRFERDGKRDFLAGIEIQATFSEGPVRLQVKGNFRSFECLEGGETVAGEPLVLAGVFRRDDPHGGGADLRVRMSRTKWRWLRLEPSAVCAVTSSGLVMFSRAARNVPSPRETMGRVFGGDSPSVAVMKSSRGRWPVAATSNFTEPP